MQLSLLLSVLSSVLIQGGYFPTVFLGITVLLASIALFQKKRALLPCECPLWGLAIWYLVASLARGYQGDSLSQACLPAAWATFLTAYNGLPIPQKERMLCGLILGNWILSGLALLSFSGIVPLAGAVASNRLQFTFQYANAAGSWFAAMALLAQDGDQRSRQTLMPALTALFLTRSIGAVGLYLLLQVVRVIKQRTLWQELVMEHVPAAIFAVLLYLVRGWIAVLIITSIYVIGYKWSAILPMMRKIQLHWVFLAVGGAGSLFLLFSQRVLSGVGTFAERLVQIRDGLLIILAHPLIGVGAGNWEVAYPYYQTAQYSSSVVHSGAIQLGVDAGIPAILLVLFFLSLAVRIKGRTQIQNLTAILLIAHSLLDLTMQFYPLMALLLAVLFVHYEPSPMQQKRSAPSVLVVICAGVLCAGLFLEEMQYKHLVRLNQNERWDEVITFYGEERPLFGSSRAALDIYIRAAYRSGDLTTVIDTTQETSTLDPEALLLRAQAMQRSGEQDDAVQLLLSRLEEQPYRVGFYQSTATLFEEWQAGREQIDKFNMLVDRANAHTTFLGTLMGNQVHIDKIPNK